MTAFPSSLSTLPVMVRRLWAANSAVIIEGETAYCVILVGSI